MSERQTDSNGIQAPTSQENRTSLTRRGVMKALGLLAVAALLVRKSSRDELIFYAKTAGRVLTPDKDLTSIRTSIETKYGVAIDEYSWDIKQLQLLDTLLIKLPSHFYGVSNGKTLKLRIGTLSNCCVQLPHEEMLQLAYYNFSPEDPRIAMRTLAHELTHRVTVMRDSEAERAWVNKLDALLGPTFITDISQKVSHAFEEQSLGQKPQWDDETKEFYERIRGTQKRHWFTLGFEDPYGSYSEFIAVGGETYVNGEDYFRRMYSLLFDESKVNLLYTMVKDDIYKGKEYPKGSN